uniref:Tripartite tricarboxylate transporter TctB family protein n=1 Tax=Pseudothermotoga hypogea TaxID=57487 RepID=A0A832IF42_9THEM
MMFAGGSFPPVFEVIDVRFGKDFYSGLVLAVLGGWMISESQKIRRLRFDVLDNAFFPTLAAVLLLIFSVGLIVQSLLSKEKSTPIKFKKPFRIALFIVSCIVYVVLMEPIGFLFSSILFVFASCLIISWPPRIRTVVYSGIFALTTSCVIWYVFARLLHLVLP